MVRDGKLYKRYDAKQGKTPPPNFEPAMEVADPVTGHFPGWLPVGDGPEDRWHREAWDAEMQQAAPDGTYELVGTKLQGNPEGFSTHQLILHGLVQAPNAPRDFQGLREYLAANDIEGIVWHHPDGRMVKIKGKDFGLKRRYALTSA
jgi:hypothetical protein